RCVTIFHFVLCLPVPRQLIIQYQCLHRRHTSSFIDKRSKLNDRSFISSLKICITKFVD
ncbi:hypothetical protein L9F63_002750, partial [Diploptera punctata]